MTDNDLLATATGIAPEPQQKPVRPPKIWGFWATLAWGVGAFGVLAAGQFGAAVLFLIWEKSAHPGFRIDLREIGNNGPLVATVTIASVPLLIGFLALAVKRSRTPLADYLAFRWPARSNAIIGAIGLGLVLALQSGLATLAGKDTPSFMTDTFASGRQAGLLPLLVIAFAAAAPIGEETLFRGFLYRGFAQKLGAPVAIVITAALWASLHIQYDWFFIAEIMMLGIYFGWVRWRSGSTLLTMTLHAAVNSIALIGLAVGQ